MKAKEAQRRQQNGQTDTFNADENNNASFEAQHRTQLFASSIGGASQVGLTQEEQVW